MQDFPTEDPGDVSFELLESLLATLFRRHRTIGRQMAAELRRKIAEADPERITAQSVALATVLAMDADANRPAEKSARRR